MFMFLLHSSNEFTANSVLQHVRPTDFLYNFQGRGDIARTGNRSVSQN